MEEKTTPCPVCGTETTISINYDRDLIFYHCPVCGQYQVGASWKERCHFNMNHLAAFLAHNAYPANDFEQRYYTTASKEICDELQKEGRGHPVHIDSEIVEAWYPKSFQRRLTTFFFIFLTMHHIWGKRSAFLRNIYTAFCLLTDMNYPPVSLCLDQMMIFSKKVISC